MQIKLFSSEDVPSKFSFTNCTVVNFHVFFKLGILLRLTFVASPYLPTFKWRLVFNAGKEPIKHKFSLFEKMKKTKFAINKQ